MLDRECRVDYAQRETWRSHRPSWAELGRMPLFAVAERAENHLHRPRPGRETGVASVVGVGCHYFRNEGATG
jgi:hypothetical protein